VNVVEYAGSFYVIVQKGTTKRLVHDFFRTNNYARETIKYLGLQLRAEVREVEVTFHYNDNNQAIEG
jgi:hypothetical protein